nr:uncharacterized protein LOC122268236 [Parasteatoda tepidariorum]
MEKTNYRNSGCVVTWKIKNIHCLEKMANVHSPYFFIGTTHKIKWQIATMPGKEKYHFILVKNNENTCISKNLSVSYDCKVTWKAGDIPEEVGVISFPKYKERDKLCIISYDSKDIDTSTTTVIFLCYFRIISDDYNSVINQYKFQTVVEAEHQRIQYTIPKISILGGQQLFIPAPLACRLTVPFEMALRLLGTDVLAFFVAKISENGNRKVLLICKFSIADEKGNNLYTETGSKEFIDGPEHLKIPNTWCLQIPINTKVLTSNKSHTLSLDIEFLISEHNTNTWRETFSSVAIDQSKELSSKKIRSFRLEGKYLLTALCVCGLMKPELFILLAPILLFLYYYFN